MSDGGSMSEKTAVSNDERSIFGQDDPEKPVKCIDPISKLEDTIPNADDKDTIAVTDVEAIKKLDDLEHGRPEGQISSQTEHYPGPLALSLLTIGICLSVFLVSLDRTIVATAIPRITDEFHSYDDVGWYGSAYLVTASALQPTYGRIFTLFSIKWSFLVALGIFELGSLICGAAPNSMALIVGRAIAGWGSAGILTGSFIIIAHSVPLQKRPVYTGAVGMMFGLGAVTGPLLGGVFTDLASWRWCFYFNLPVGGFTVAAMVLFFKPQKHTHQNGPLTQKILRLDPIGNAILLVASVMFFLALQFNERGYAWNSSRVIGLLVGSGVTTLLFIIWQRQRGDQALIPPSIILQRSVAVSCVAAFFIYGTMLIHSYYLPIYFQAIRNASAIASGVDMIAYMLANAVFALLTGALVSKLGFFAPPAIIGAAIATVGCGLLTTLQVDTPSSKWIGYEILVAAGLGMAIQQGFIAVQTVLRLDQVPIGVAAVTSFQSLGGSVFVSVGNSILQNRLLHAASAHELLGVDIHAVITAGATQFRSLVSKEALPTLLTVYNGALQKVFIAAIPLSGLAFVAALGLEWKSVKGKQGDTIREVQNKTDVVENSEVAHKPESDPNWSNVLEAWLKDEKMGLACKNYSEHSIKVS